MGNQKQQRPDLGSMASAECHVRLQSPRTPPQVAHLWLSPVGISPLHFFLHRILPSHPQVPRTSRFFTPQAPPHTKTRQEEDSPTEDHDEVHDIPAIAEVRALMEDEPQGYDFDPSFKAKDPDEIRFCLLLWDEEQRCW